MKLKTSDQVMIISGKDKGKSGKIMRLMRKTNQVVVEKINLRTKHIKKTAEKAGQRIQFEAPLNASNVMVLCPNCKKAARIGYKKLANGKKERICKKCKETVDSEFKKSK